MHGWAVTQSSTLIPQTSSWGNFQPNNSAHLIQITESHARSKVIRGSQKPPGEQKKRGTAPLVSTAASGQLNRTMHHALGQISDKEMLFGFFEQPDDYHRFFALQEEV